MSVKMLEPHNPHLIRSTRTHIEAQMMAGTYCTAADEEAREREEDLKGE